MKHLNASDILKLAAHVADTGGFCLAMAFNVTGYEEVERSNGKIRWIERIPTGYTWRLAVLPGEAKPYAVQIQHTWLEKGQKCHAWHEWDAFELLIDAAAAFCALVGNKIGQMSEV